MAAASSIALGAAAAGGIGGAIAGASDDVTTQNKNVAPATAQERQLQEQSIQNYFRQQALADQQEQSMNSNGASQIQGGARGVMDSILNGQSFTLSPEEMANLQNIRQSTVQAGMGDINKFVDARLQALQGDAANRGVRGQALSQLQVGALNEGTDRLANLEAQANADFQRQAAAMPMQRMQLQGGFAQNNLTFQDSLRQQAMANRQALQNPALMSALQNERLQAAGVTTTHEGSVGGAIGGFFGGAGSMVGAAGNAKKAGLI